MSQSDSPSFGNEDGLGPDTTPGRSIHEMELARGVSHRVVLMDKDRIAEQDVCDYICWVSCNERTRAFLARSDKWVITVRRRLG